MSAVTSSKGRLQSSAISFASNFPVFNRRRAEVIAMSIFEYDKVEEEKKLRKAEFDAGVEQGIEQGLKQASTDTALRLLKTGKFDAKEIAELCNLPLEDVTALMKIRLSML